MFRSLLLAVLLVLPLSSNAALSIQPIELMSGLNWSVSGASSVGYSSSCNVLFLDANGSINGTGKYAGYGAFNCPAINGGYAVSGSGYITTVGTFTMNLYVALAMWQCTINQTTLNGSCTVTALSTGNQLGTLLLTFIP